MQLALSTWQEVEEYLQRESGIVVPIGSVEQHGPNGLIGTDFLDAEFVAKGLGDAVGCLVAPTLTYGMSQHHLGFAGSATLRPSTLMMVVRDVVLSLSRHGFERFFFINGHGGNVATVTAAFDEIYAETSLGAERPPIKCRMTFWSGGPRAKKLASDLYGDSNREPCDGGRSLAVAVLPARCDQAGATASQGGAQERLRWVPRRRRSTLPGPRNSLYPLPPPSQPLESRY